MSLQALLCLESSQIFVTIQSEFCKVQARMCSFVYGAQLLRGACEEMATCSHYQLVNYCSFGLWPQASNYDAVCPPLALVLHGQGSVVRLAIIREQHPVRHPK